MQIISVQVSAALIAIIATNPASQEPATIFPAQLNFTAPTSSALSILGVADSKAVNPANLQELTTSLVNGFDESGRLQQGFAFSSSLSTLNLGPRYIDGRNYFTDIRKRLQWGTTLSLAATRGDTASNPAGRLAVGVTFPLIDLTDWRADKSAANELATITKETLLSIPTPAPGNLKQASSSVETLRNAVTNSAAKEILTNIAAMLSESIAATDATLQAKLAVLEAQQDSNEAQRLAAMNPNDAALQMRYTASLDKVKVQKEYLGTKQKKSDELLKIAQKALDDLLKEQPTTSETGEETEPGPSQWDLWTSTLKGPEYTKRSEKFVKDWNERSWNKRKLDVSFAHSLFANNAQKDSFRADGTFAWVAFSEPIDKHSKFTAYYRFSNKERSFDTDANAWLVGNGNQIGGAYRYGSSTQTFFLEYLYKDISGTLAKRRRETIWQGGYETKIGGDQWLQVVLGRSEGAATSRNIFGVTLSFNLSPSKQLSVR